MTAPTLLSNGTTRPAHIYSGVGRLYVSNLDANGFPYGGFRDLGEVPEYTITLAKEEREKRSSRDAVRTIIRNTLVSQDGTLRVVMDELNFHNFAEFLSGSVSTASQGSLSITGLVNLEITELDRWYDLYDTADMTTGGYPQGNRAYQISSVQLQTTGGGTVWVEGTDFDVDAVMGRVFIRSSGGIPAGTVGSPTVIDADFAGAAITLEQVSALDFGNVTKAFKLIGENANDPGTFIEFHMHAVTLSADGDASLIGTDDTQLTMTGPIEKREAVDPTFPVIRVTYPKPA